MDRQSARNAGQKGGGEQPLNALEFDRLVQKYQSLVYTICRQLVADEGYAQDLTQETFLSAWRSIDRCPAGYEKQWLARIASNKAKDYLRSAWARRVNTPGVGEGNWQWRLLPGQLTDTLAEKIYAMTKRCGRLPK